MKLPESGFKFNCGLDICEYPMQYCDTEDNRCGYCSVDVCNSGVIPQQCETECNRLSTTTVQPVVPDSIIASYYTSSDKSVIGAYAIAIIALLLVLVLYLRWYKNSKKNKGKRHGNNDYQRILNNYNNRSTINVPDDATIPEGHEQVLQENQEIPTAPPGHSTDQPEAHVPCSAAYIDTPIVTHPDDNGSSNSRNLGDHNIIPPLTEDLETTLYQSSQSNGPVSQAMDDSNCDKPDHNILSDSKDFKISVHETTYPTQARKSTMELSELLTKPSELTVAKEQTRPDRVC